MTLPAGFPRPDHAQRVETARLVAGIPDGSVLLVDQLVLGVLPDLARQEGKRLRLAMIVHHPLALEDLSDPAEASRLHLGEREALAHVSLAIVPSLATARILVSDYALPEQRLIIAAPGTDPKPIAPGAPGRALSLLSIGSVVPRKDHGLLLRALAGLERLPWRLTIIGDTERAPAHVHELHALAVRLGLVDRVTFTGGIDADALEPLWREAGLYVASSRHEGYGMAIAEALSRGIPVVSTEAGAVADWVDCEAVKLVPAGNVEALCDALRLVLTDPDARLRMQSAARRFRSELPTWRSQAELVDTRLRRLVGD